MVSPLPVTVKPSAAQREADKQCKIPFGSFCGAQQVPMKIVSLIACDVFRFVKPCGEMKMAGLQGKKILVGVTGSIAAFKAAAWVHALVKEEAEVTVVMTRAATRFVSALTFTALSGKPVHVEMFADDPGPAMAHITLGRDADLILIAPATANTLARLAHGLADDLLATAVLAASG